MKYWILPFLAALLCASSVVAADAPVRLFILSGQSNMKHVIPEEMFLPALRGAFPNDDLVVVKFSDSGQPIRRWLAEWKNGAGEVPPGRPPGDHYERLMEMVKAAMEGKPRPVSVTFVWMQGEADADVPESAPVYEESLRALIAKLRRDLGRPDMSFVVGRITDFQKNPKNPNPAGWDTVRKALETVADADPLGAWVDTDDLNGKIDDGHMTKSGYATLGQRFADAAIVLLTKPVPGS